MCCKKDPWAVSTQHLSKFLVHHSTQPHWAPAYRIVQYLKIRCRLRDLSALFDVVPKHVIVHLGGFFLLSAQIHSFNSAPARLLLLPPRLDLAKPEPLDATGILGRF